jgi:hypothetical protein
MENTMVQRVLILELTLLYLDKKKKYEEEEW